ncbi:pre-toxin TG domain-containing protein [Enterococcus sp. AZ101]|uniref:pre-toxin TG domain-containing protein n=1 Tax=Enterococcus sp. AZ101 TaxID=2774742 RepID=UPI003D298011
MKKLGIALTNMAGEMTGMYSLYRLFTGTDPVTGSKVSRLEAGLWVALLLLPQAKMVEAVKTLRAGDRALAGAALTEADLMILSKAGYFDDVAKINKIEKVSGAGVPNPDLGVVQSRVNIANGRTRFTPTRPSTGKPVSAGFEHVLDGHFNRPIANSRSIFSITADKLKQVLQSPNVVKSTVIDMSGGQYKRIVDTGEIIGNTALKHGGNPTSWIEVITDRAGNLITTYPVPKP